MEPKADQTAKDPWWKWIVDDPKKAVRLAFFALALLGYDQWAASRVADVKDTVKGAVDKADTNAKVVSDLFEVVSDVRVLVGEVKAENQVMLKAVNPTGECKCGPECPCKK